MYYFYILINRHNYLYNIKQKKLSISSQESEGKLIYLADFIIMYSLILKLFWLKTVFYNNVATLWCMHRSGHDLMTTL